MSISVTNDRDKKQHVIRIKDRFDFAIHQQFREAYQNINENGIEYKLDLSATQYMDSSALGMILLLKDHADKFKSSVVIYKPAANVAKVLEIAQFHQLLTIEH